MRAALKLRISGLLSVSVFAKCFSIWRLLLANDGLIPGLTESVSHHIRLQPRLSQGFPPNDSLNDVQRQQFLIPHLTDYITRLITPTEDILTEGGVCKCCITQSGQTVKTFYDLEAFLKWSCVCV